MSNRESAASRWSVRFARSDDEHALALRLASPVARFLRLACCCRLRGGWPLGARGMVGFLVAHNGFLVASIAARCGRALGPAVRFAAVPPECVSEWRL